MNDYTNYTNSNVKYLREKKKISQGKLSEDLEIDQSTLAKWENNTRQITLGWAIKIAEYFNVLLGDFISKDLRLQKNQNCINNQNLSQEEELNILKRVLKHRGILNENEEMSKEDLDRLMEFAKRNKDFIIKNKK